MKMKQKLNKIPKINKAGSKADDLSCEDSDDASLGYVLFRDVDSVISHREATSVRAWIDSGKTVSQLRTNKT